MQIKYSTRDHLKKVKPDKSKKQEPREVTVVYNEGINTAQSGQKRSTQVKMMSMSVSPERSIMFKFKASRIE